MLLEVATWNGPNIHRTSWALGLRSEASGRFEKGLQPEQCMHAQAVAGALMVELCGATLAPGTIDIGGDRDGRRATADDPAARARACARSSACPSRRERQAEILARARTSPRQPRAPTASR